MKMIYRNLVCGFRLADYFSCAGFFPDGYARDTMVYALERFFRKNEEVRAELVTRSWKIRMAKGKARRPRRITLTVPAAALELPCGTVRIRLMVDACGVEVREFLLLDAASRRTDPFIWTTKEASDVQSEAS